MHLDENPINQSNITLEFANVHTKSHLLLNIKPLNFIAYGFIDIGCNKNCIITNYTLTLVPHECILHDHIIMFHVHGEFKQSMLWAQLSWLPCYNASFISGSCMGLDGENH